MLRVICLVSMAFALIRCSSDDPTQVSSCNYESAPQKEIKLSASPQTMGLPFDQEKIVSLLWTPSAQSECFLKKNGSVQLFKLPSQESRPEDTFVTLKSATSQALQNWNQAESNVATTLLGLTTVSFVSVPQEKIVETQIIVRSEGRPWHLWHEYIHFLIAQSRVDSPDLIMDAVTEETVVNRLDEALAKMDRPEEFQKLFLDFSNLQMDFLQKAFVEEILIESTLLELTAQAGGLIEFDSIDRTDSENVILFFYERYIQYVQNATLALLAKTATLPADMQSLVDQHQSRLIDHHNRLKNLIP